MSHQNESDDLALARTVAWVLRQSETVDRSTAAKLAAARRSALAIAGKSAPVQRWLVPAGVSFAAVSLVAVLALRQQPQIAQGPTVANAHEVDALDLLTDEMSPAFYRDLEFYQWLEKERPHA